MDGKEVSGFNSEVSYRGLTYHVQTETMADPSNPVINTLVFREGALLEKMSTSYADIERPDENNKSLAERIRRQHQAAMTRVKNGDFV